MNTTANADAMTAILRQISLDWNRTISYGRSYIAIFFAYVPGFTCLMAATGSTLASVAGAAIGGAASGFLMLNITLFSYEQMNNHHWMNGIVPISRNHQILGRFAFLIVCDLVAGLEVAVSIACAGIIIHEPVKVTDAIGFAALVRTQDIPHIGGTDGLLTQHASIEDVIRLTNAAAHTAIGNTNEGDVR